MTEAFFSYGYSMCPILYADKIMSCILLGSTSIVINACIWLIAGYCVGKILVIIYCPSIRIYFSSGKYLKRSHLLFKQGLSLFKAELHPLIGAINFHFSLNYGVQPLQESSRMSGVFSRVPHSGWALNCNFPYPPSHPPSKILLAFSTSWLSH